MCGSIKLFYCELSDYFTKIYQPISCRHIFAIGNAAYETMLRKSSNQVVVISGESGAGKTESTKLLVHYIAAINQPKGSLITEQVTVNVL